MEVLMPQRNPKEFIRLKSMMNQIERSKPDQLASLDPFQRELVELRGLLAKQPNYSISGKAKKIEFPNQLSFDDIQRMGALKELFGKSFVAKRYGS